MMRPLAVFRVELRRHDAAQQLSRALLEIELIGASTVLSVSVVETDSLEATIVARVDPELVVLTRQAITRHVPLKGMQ